MYAASWCWVPTVFSVSYSFAECAPLQLSAIASTWVIRWPVSVALIICEKGIYLLTVATFQNGFDYWGLSLPGCDKWLKTFYILLSASSASSSSSSFPELPSKCLFTVWQIVLHNLRAGTSCSFVRSVPYHQQNIVTIKTENNYNTAIVITIIRIITIITIEIKQTSDQ